MDILQFLRAAGAPVPATNFETPDWSVSRLDAAVVLTDEDEINQTIRLICSTATGSDPLRPEFGADYLPVLDAPLNRATPVLVARLNNALATWETRIKVLAVDVTATAQGVLTVFITWQRATAARTGVPRTTSFALA